MTSAFTPLPRIHAAVITLAAMIFAFLVSAQAAAESVLITDSRHPIATSKNIRTLYLDLPATLEDELSANLPSDPEAAQATFNQRMTPELAARLTQAHQNVADAWSMGVTKIPAVVIDRRYVVYGESNIRRALERIEEHRRAEP